METLYPLGVPRVKTSMPEVAMGPVGSDISSVVVVVVLLL